MSVVNVLLVEDDAVHARLLKETLREHGDIRITHVVTLAAAEAELKRTAFDLVLLDLGLPDSSGVGTLERLRRDHVDVATLVLTGAEDDAVALAAVGAGAQDHLDKGAYGPETTSRAIRHAVERHRFQRERERSHKQRGALLRFSQLALQDLDRGVLEEAAVKLLLEAAPALRAAVFDVDHDAATLVLRAWRGEPADVGPGHHLALDRDSIAGAVALARDAMIVDDIAAEADRFPAARELPTTDLVSAIGAPVVYEGRTSLVLLAYADEAGVFDEEDLSFVTGMANALAETVRRRAAEANLNERVKELNALFEVGVALEGTGEVTEICQRVANYLAAGMRWPERCWATVAIDDAVGTSSGHGADEPWAEVPIMVDGIERGRITVGYDEPGGLLLTEEVALLRSVAESLAQWLNRQEVSAELQRREEQLRLTVSQLPGVVWTADTELRISSLTGAAIEATGVGAGDLVGRRLGNLLGGSASDPGTLDGVHEALAGGSVTVESRWGERWWRTWCEPLRDATGRIIGIAGLSLDVTDEHDKDEALAASRERLQGLFDNTLDAMLLVDDGGRRIDANPAAVELTGYSREELLALDRFELGVTTDEVAEARWQRLHAEGSLETILPIRRKDGAIFQTEFRAVADIVPGIHLYVLRDITRLHDLEEELSYRRLHDEVTDLPNRTLLTDRVEHALRIARRDGTLVGVAVLDLDEFKQINDSLGHEVGDEVLVEVARRLKSVLREADTAARLSGDEFAVLLEALQTTEGAAEVVERILDALRRPFRLADREISVTASVGIAVGASGDEAPALLRDADAAMHIAKGAGRNRFAVFEEDMHLAANRRLELRSELAAAIDEGAFDLHFQPIMDLASGKVCGAEALLRWDHPTLGSIPPGGFIPVAEQSGLMVSLGWLVAERACRHLAVWQQRWPGFELCVNVSARQLYEDDFVARLGLLMDRYGIEDGRLCVELTEGALLDVERVVPLLERLGDLGVRIAVDDFGTGYSSFAYLRRFAIDAIKIDREFIAGIHEGPDQAAIARAILQLASTLDLSVIAEGVEFDAQEELLRAWGCGTAQGWLWAAAMPADEFAEWTEERGVVTDHQHQPGSADPVPAAAGRLADDGTATPGGDRVR